MPNSTQTVEVVGGGSNSLYLESMNFLNAKNDAKNLVLIKLNPLKTNAFFDAFSTLSQNPMEGVSISGSYNVFGVWDIAIWFEADSNDNALHFVGDKIRAMDSVVETHTMPATAIKEYMSSSSSGSSNMLIGCF